MKKQGYPKIIDVKKSDMDMEESKRRGVPVFTKKVYYKFRDNTGLAPWYFYWGPKNDEATLSMLMQNENYEFVTKDDPYIPEGLKLNAEKRWQLGDLVLLKCPLQEYVERRVDSRKLAEARVKSRKDQFSREAAAEGIQTLSEEELHNILGE